MSDTSYGDDAPHEDGDGDEAQPPTVIHLAGGATVSAGHGASIDGIVNGIPLQIADGQATLGVPGETTHIGDPVAVQGDVQLVGDVVIDGGLVVGQVQPPAAGAGHVYYDEAAGQLLVDGDDGPIPLVGALPHGDQITLTAGSAPGVGDGGNVVLSGGKGGVGGEDGKVIVEGDLHITGDVIRLAGEEGVVAASLSFGKLDSPLLVTHGARELLRIGADGEVSFGEPLSKEELADVMGLKGGFMDVTTVVLSVLLSEIVRLREEVERLRSRVE